METTHFAIFYKKASQKGHTVNAETCLDDAKKIWEKSKGQKCSAILYDIASNNTLNVGWRYVP